MSPVKAVASAGAAQYLTFQLGGEMFAIGASDIEAPPAFGARIRTDFIQGMGKVKDKGKFVILLDLDRSLSVDDLASLAQPPAPAQALINA